HRPAAKENLLEPGEGRKQPGEKKQQPEGQHHRSTRFAASGRDGQSHGQREQQDEKQSQKHSREFAAGHSAQEKRQPQHGKDGKQSVDRLNRGRRQLAEHDIEPVQVGQEQQTQRSIALLNAQTVGG